tara:strand:- start:5822 stop:5935 length:114 start_codon:yes stop_codon:yes gene_type:complete
MAIGLVMGIMFGLGLMVANRWLCDRQVIFVPASGIEV